MERFFFRKMILLNVFLSTTTWAAGTSGLYPNDTAFQNCEQGIMTNYELSIAGGLQPNKICVYVDPPNYTYNWIKVNYYLCAVPLGPLYWQYQGQFCLHGLPSNSTPTVTTSIMSTNLGNKNVPNACGSFINPSKKSVSESIPIDGTDLDLVNSSEFNPKRTLNHSFNNELHLKNFNFGGQYYIEVTSPNQQTNYASFTDFFQSLVNFNIPWDETTNAYSSHPALNKVDYRYSFAERLSGAGGQFSFSGVSPHVIDIGYRSKDSIGGLHFFSLYSTVSTVPAAQYSPVIVNFDTLAVYHPEAWGFAGWTLSNHHFFNKQSKILYRGNGEKIKYNTFQTATISIYGQVNLLSRYEDDELYIFDLNGQHLETRSKILSLPIYKFSYDSNYKLTTVTNRFNKQIQIVYDSSGNLEKIIAPYGQQTLFTLTNGNITQVQNSLGKNFGLQYNNMKLLTELTKPNLEVTTFNYDANGDFLSESKNSGASQDFVATVINAVKSFTHSTASGLKLKTDISASNGYASASIYDGNGTLLKSTIEEDSETRENFLGGTAIVSYRYKSDPIWGNSLNKLAPYKEAYVENSASITYLPVNYKTFSYLNQLDATTLQSVVNTSSNPGEATWISSKIDVSLKKITINNQFINLPTVITLSGDETISQIASATSYPTNFSYDSDGRVAHLQKANAYEDFEYDAYGFLKKITNSKGQVTEFIRDSQGQILTKKLPNLDELNFEYTDGGEVKKITTAASQDHTFGFSLGDFLETYLTPTNKTTTYSYNSDKLVSQVLFPSNRAITYTYNSANLNLETAQTPLGNYTYTQDSWNRYTQMTSADSIKIELQWLGRKVKNITWKDADNSTIGSINYTYGTTTYKTDSIAINSTHTWSFSYNSNTGRLSNISSNATTGGSVTYSYGNTADSNGIKDSTISTSGTTAIKYQSVDSNNGANPKKSVNFLALTNGPNASKVTIDRTFDNFGQATEYSTKIVESASNTFLSGSKLIPYYDQNGRLKQIEKSHQTLASGDITTTVDYYNNYGYFTGANNNLEKYSRTLTASGSAPIKQYFANFSSDDRLLSTSGDLTRSYTYNDDGQMTTKTDPTGTTTYSYDVFGNLKSVALPNTNLIEYKVDGQNRRVKKLINGNVVEYYLWFDNTHLAAVLDSNKIIKISFMYGPGSDSPSFINKNGINYRVVQDPALGSIRYIIHPTTLAIAQEIDYDEFGDVLSNSNPGFQPLGFAGGLFDTDTKLIRFGARDYDPSIGRWTTKDPIGFAGGDTNLYAYVNGDPMSFVDPSGLRLTFAGQLSQNLAQIWSTPAGYSLMTGLMGSSQTYNLTVNTLGNHFQSGNMVTVDPGDHPFIYTSNGFEAASTTRILAHEMGHLTGMLDDGLNSMNNVNLFENPIMQQLGAPRRTSYTTPGGGMCGR